MWIGRKDGVLVSDGVEFKLVHARVGAMLFTRRSDLSEE